MSASLSTGVIEKKVLIQAAPAVIFQALTEARDLAQWFCDRATSEAKVGGELKAYWRLGAGGEAQRGRAVFTALVPDSQVELQWIDEGAGAAAGSEKHSVLYMIRIKRGTSELSVRDQGPPFTGEETQEVLSEGWISVLRDLKEHCESRQRSARRRTAAAGK